MVVMILMVVPVLTMIDACQEPMMFWVWFCLIDSPLRSLLGVVLFLGVLWSCVVYAHSSSIFAVMVW